MNARCLLQNLVAAAVAVAVVALVAAGAASQEAPASTAPAVSEVIANVNARLAGRSVSRKIEMTMTTRRGQTRTRRTGSFRKYDADDLRSVVYFLAPANVRGSAFLSYDYGDLAREDDQWLYLPSLRRVRRVAASDRGDYFMGTDFTYDDVKHETDLSANDYHWKLDGSEARDERECLVLEGEPVDADTAEALGYSRLRVCVATDSWIPIHSEYWDNDGERLKTVRVSEIRLVDEVWTPHRIDAERHDNGHRTSFVITNTDYEAELDDLIFAKRSLDSIPPSVR
jgi:hypothetical protein